MLKGGTSSLLKCFLASAAIIGVSATNVHASNADILFILDGSGSMWGQIDKVAKITTAKETLTKLVDDVPDGARVGLMTYGTQSKESCVDFQTLNEVGASAKAIKESIAGIKPLGKTPMGMSLSVGIASLSKTEPQDRQKAVVLISDGIETCNSDPCTSAAMSQHLGIDMKVHVVGFDVDAEAKAQLQCIANAGGGQYFNADDTEGFTKAMRDVVEVAQAPVVAAPVAEPEPAPKNVEPVITEYFREDFDGETLGEDFIISNENPDNYIIENGVLTMLSTSKGGFGVEAPENLLTYTGKLPKGNWDAVLVFKGDYSSVSDRLSFGFRKDKDNYLTGVFGHNFTSGCHRAYLQNLKNQKGKLDKNTLLYRATNGLDCYPQPRINWESDWTAIQADLQKMNVILTVSKRGRSYTTAMVLDGFMDADGNPYVVKTEQFTALRAPGDLSFTVDKPLNGDGEVLMEIESFAIHEVKSAAN